MLASKRREFGDNWSLRDGGYFEGDVLDAPDWLFANFRSWPFRV